MRATEGEKLDSRWQERLWRLQIIFDQFTCRYSGRIL